MNEIIKLEYEMFDKVKSMGGRASCQDDFNTFFAMRYSQFIVLKEDTLESYKADLLRAKNDGRNLLTKKYAHMMEYTDKEYFDQMWRDKLHVTEKKG